jgi:hypothetical protein
VNKKILITAAILSMFALGANADTTTSNAASQADAASTANSASTAKAEANTVNNNTPIINVGTTADGRSLFLPNSSASVLPNPVTFINNGAGLAEKNNKYAKMFAEFTRGVEPVSALMSERGKTISKETEYATLTWQPYADYYTVMPSEREVPTAFMPIITDLAKDFGNMDKTATYYVIGHVAVVTPRDSDWTDTILQETLIAESKKFLVSEVGVTGFSEITPMVIFEASAFHQGTGANGSGFQLTPQFSMFPGTAGVGSLFSFQKNNGQATPEYRLSMKIVFLAKAPNPTQGHAIPAMIQDINATHPEKLVQ